MQKFIDLDDITTPVTQHGDEWHLGAHRLLCSNVNEDAVASFLGYVVPNCLLTDPPYSSGGFQESGKSAGSVGRTVSIPSPTTGV